MQMASRQLAFVIDLNKCMGCQTCVVACKIAHTNGKGQDHQWWMTVTSMPGVGYPKNWESMGGGIGGTGEPVIGKVPSEADYGTPMEFNYEDVFFAGVPAGSGGTKFGPKDQPSWGPNWEEDIGGGDWPNAWLFYLPRTCNHCSNPSCLPACPVSAVAKRADGVVEIADQGACESCSDSFCMAACPYKVIFRDSIVGHASKCNACAPRIDEGIAPACVRMCPGRCIWVGYLDEDSSAVARLVNEFKVAVPLHPEFGCEPNVFYVPPISPPRLAVDGTPDLSEPRIPNEELLRLFGPPALDALATIEVEMSKRRRRPKERSDLMEILIARRTSELLGPFLVDPADAVEAGV